MATALPAADTKRNGMVDIQKRLIDDPAAPIIAVVMLDSAQTTIDHLKHTKTPTLRIMHIEPMLLTAQRDIAVRLLTEAYRDRTTEQLELPLFNSIVGEPDTFGDEGYQDMGDIR